MTALLTTGDSLVIKANDADSRIVMESLQYDVTSASFACNSKTYPLVGQNRFHEIVFDKGKDVTLTVTTGSMYARWRQEKVSV